MTNRQGEILRALVKEYVASGEPVGSQILVEKFGMAFSPATVRKEMSVLEQMGLLSSPHTSAGRVPTDRAFQLYLADLVNLFEITLNQKAELEDLYRSAALQLDQLLKTTAQMLAQTSNFAGIVLAPNSVGSSIKRIELVSVMESLVLMIMISSSGAIYEKKIKLERVVSQEDLYKISRYLNQNLKGFELGDVQERGLEFLSGSLAELGELSDIGTAVTQAIVYNPPDQTIHIEGDTNLHRKIYDLTPDRRKAERIITQLANKDYISSVFEKMKNQPQVGSQVGLEIDGEILSGITILGKGYTLSGKSVGALGVIGANRMPYEKIIPALDYSSQILSNVLSEKSNIELQGDGRRISEIEISQIKELPAAGRKHTKGHTPTKRK
ncbi:MAG: heat-inducible transcription repressor HrcA [Leptospiraceae bacterium]|nr:heat-inducible transcription repressor HrcA [Leptospiraceae bacterium]